jgi:hypothetical protein
VHLERTHTAAFCHAAKDSPQPQALCNVITAKQRSTYALAVCGFSRRAVLLTRTDWRRNPQTGSTPNAPDRPLLCFSKWCVWIQMPTSTVTSWRNKGVRHRPLPSY